MTLNNRAMGHFAPDLNEAYNNEKPSNIFDWLWYLPGFHPMSEISVFLFLIEVFQWLTFLFDCKVLCFSFENE